MFTKVLFGDKKLQTSQIEFANEITKFWVTFHSLRKYKTLFVKMTFKTLFVIQIVTGFVILKTGILF